MIYLFLFFFKTHFVWSIPGSDLTKHRLPIAKSVKEKVKLLPSICPHNPTYFLLEKRLVQMQSKNIQRTYFNGYTIQVYMGESRTQALAHKNQLHKLLPTIKSIDIFYQKPNFLVQIGNFITYIEIQVMYRKIQKSMPNAIIRPKKILIKTPITYYLPFEH